MQDAHYATTLMFVAMVSVTGGMGLYHIALITRDRNYDMSRRVIITQRKRYALIAVGLVISLAAATVAINEMGLSDIRDVVVGSWQIGGLVGWSMLLAAGAPVLSVLLAPIVALRVLVRPSVYAMKKKGMYLLTSNVRTGYVGGGF
jgi:hypothetical protein